MNTLIKNASLVNEGTVLVCDVLIEGEIIKEIRNSRIEKNSLESF